jgi:glutamyl-tRNA reductase
MEVFVLGSSQSVASARERELLHVDVDEMYEALDDFLARGLLDEAVPLATCGRVEVYGASRHPERALRALRTLLAHRTGIAPDRIAEHSYVHRNRDAVVHLFRVAAGLDSVVYGEAQIIGQVRDALEDPRTRETAGTFLLRLFQNALAAGKRVRTETKVGHGAVSLAGAALQLLQSRVGSLEPLSAVVLGAGDTGVLMARLLRKEGLRRLTVANRTLDRAERVARELGGTATGLDDIPGLVSGADIVVGAVGESFDLVTPELMNGTLTGANARDRYFIDLAHPRNFHPEMASQPGVYLVDLEKVFSNVEEARHSREAETPRAEALVSEEADAFMKWMRTRESTAVLKAVREQVLETARTEAERYARGRSEKEREDVLRLARSLARSLLHAPTVALREADPTNAEGRKLLENATSLFGVEVSGNGNGSTGRS